MNKTFGKKKLVRDISANTLQTVITQLFGLVIFYITSKYLPKNDYGELNWSMALGSTIITIASFGLDLVFVRKIATGENVLLIAGIHLFHTILVGVTLTMLLAFIWVFPSSFTSNHPYFFIVFLSLAIANIANSLKLCLNGLESYKQLALLALYSNILKFLLILFLYLGLHFNVINIIWSYVITSLLEFILGYYFVARNISNHIKPVIKKTEYKAFIIQSLPQLGVVIFDSALARIDWILLGVISTAAATAEYSFVYKIFELSKLPLLVIAPVLLTRFSKLFKDSQTPTDKQKNEIQLFLKIEMIIIMIIPIVLISCWTPLMDYLTNFKYGSVNETNYEILAICVPLGCLINFLWTFAFAQGQLKTIMFITIVVSLLNILANAVLIPLYGGLGASMSFLICTVIQLILYLKFIKRDKIKFSLYFCIFPFLSAFLAIATAKFLSNSAIFTPLLSVCIYVGLIIITRQVNFADLKTAIKTK